MQMDFGNPRHCAEDNVFDAGLGSGSHGDGVAIASQAGGNPENGDFRDWLRGLRVTFSNLRGISHSISTPKEPAVFRLIRTDRYSGVFYTIPSSTGAVSRRFQRAAMRRCSSRK
jgi:hypothetical protein